MESHTWIHRRVERVAIEATGECTRHISFDFTLPEQWTVKGSQGRVLVPLGLMEKGPLAAFSIEGPDGKAISLLETQANARLADALLCRIARNMLGEGALDWTRFDALVTLCVREEATAAQPAVSELKGLVRNVNPPPDEENTLSGLFEQFAANFLFVVEVAEEMVGRRSIVKMTYREPRESDELRPIRPTLKWELPEFGAAAGTHFEFSPPPLLMVASARLDQLGGQEKVKTVAEMAAPGSTCHLVARPEHRFVRASVTLDLVPRRFGAMTATWWGACAMVGALVAILLLRWARASGYLPMAPIGAGTPAVLLAVSGVLLTWIARSPEDWTTAQILSNARLSLMASAGLAAVAAVVLAVPVDEPGRTVIWVLLLVLAVVNLLVAFLQRWRCRS